MLSKYIIIGQYDYIQYHINTKKRVGIIVVDKLLLLELSASIIFTTNRTTTAAVELLQVLQVGILC